MDFVKKLLLSVSLIWATTEKLWACEEEEKPRLSFSFVGYDLEKPTPTPIYSLEKFKEIAKDVWRESKTRKDSLEKEAILHEEMPFVRIIISDDENIPLLFSSLFEAPLELLRVLMYHTYPDILSSQDPYSMNKITEIMKKAKINKDASCFVTQMQNLILSQLNSLKFYEALNLKINNEEDLLKGFYIEFFRRFFKHKASLTHCQDNQALLLKKLSEVEGCMTYRPESFRVEEENIFKSLDANRQRILCQTGKTFSDMTSRLEDKYREFLTLLSNKSFEDFIFGRKELTLTPLKHKEQIESFLFSLERRIILHDTTSPIHRLLNAIETFKENPMALEMFLKDLEDRNVKDINPLPDINKIEELRCLITRLAKFQEENFLEKDVVATLITNTTLILSNEEDVEAFFKILGSMENTEIIKQVCFCMNVKLGAQDACLEKISKDFTKDVRSEEDLLKSALTEWLRARVFIPFSKEYFLQKINKMKKEKEGEELKINSMKDIRSKEIFRKRAMKIKEKIEIFEQKFKWYQSPHNNFQEINFFDYFEGFVAGFQKGERTLGKGSLTFPWYG